MDINKAKDTVISAGKELVKRGLIARTWGNVSQKVDDESMVITPSGKDYLSLTREDIVVVNINTLDYSGQVKPSSEKGVHASCYRDRDDIRFVIHTHQEIASIVSTCGIDSIRVDERYSHLAERVACAPYGLPSTKKLCKGITDTLQYAKGNCIIMKHHGALCMGEDYEQAFEAANQLEMACAEYLEQRYVLTSGAQRYDASEQAEYVLSKHGVSVDDLTPKPLDIDLDDYYIIVNDAVEVVALSYLHRPIKPMVDDFAQIVGTKIRIVSNDIDSISKALKKANAVLVTGYGAVCIGISDDDAHAVSMIVEKNAKAYIGASLHGRAKPINAFESKLMNTVYKMKYSKQIDK